ncbi:hypothetical protein [Flammeovirga agarivorans]|uniref:Alpha-galactosidase n=1 Tax=Flammeovirga agarivorans TaxID=2726742 RepID=A0A7X8SN82_9BACT|nr:hypothetical protein [Flammeovirga agarivorans]NLR93311.1 hypothetical protein [Flammeovirga agarivorans]
MKNNKYLYLLFVVILLISSYKSFQSDLVMIENDFVRIEYDAQEGYYHIYDKSQKRFVVEKAFTKVNNYYSTNYSIHQSTIEELNDGLGEGQKLTVVSSKGGNPDIIVEFMLYNYNSYLVLNLGIDNTTDNNLRIHTMSPLQKGIAYDNTKFESYIALDGYSGGSLGWEWPGHGHTTSVHTQSLTSENNLMLTFGKSLDEKNTLVMGGLTYKEFAKKAEAKKYLSHLELSLWCEDGVGKLVDANTKYLPNEKFYIDFNEKNPFEALEKYALIVKMAQKVELNYYTFPTLCLWYTHTNNTTDGVKQMEAAVEKGITKYSSLGIRIVPDNYDDNNINGWFDDEHWQKYGFYTAPYETSEKFAQAIIERGGIPFQYFQSTKTSTDYSEQFPEQCLFNEGTKKTGNLGPDWNIIGNGGYDVTDKDFEKHLKDAYAHIYQAGFKGIMIDYPHLSWHEDGGFDDKYTTTAGFHRKYFELAYNGLGGKKSFVHERMRDSDVTLGAVSSKRTEGDTWSITPNMIKHTSLRWYKNRVLVNWDMDAKDYTKVKSKNRDAIRTMFTMTYVVSGRLLLGHSLYDMPDSVTYDLTRTLPYPALPQTARPLDAFSLEKFCPEIFDYKVNEKWHQLTLYNSKHWKAENISVDLSQNVNFSGLGLDMNKEYHVYDYWNDTYVSKVKGGETLTQTVRGGEARMLSVHEVEENPQFISTNRHIMQGMLDLYDVDWSKANKTLTGTSKVIAEDTYEVVIAKNNYKIQDFEVSSGKAELVEINDDLVKLVINSPENKEIKWGVQFNKNIKDMR